MRATQLLTPAARREVRRRTIFQCGKFDPQCEDIDVLCPFAIVLEPSEWGTLTAAAQALTAEVMAAEQALLNRPDLLKQLGLPRAIRRVLARRRNAARSGPRVMRFDFHWTTDGWRISEANTDVPGGFIEGSGFTRVVSEHFPGMTATCDPAATYADALLRTPPAAPVIGLVHATAYTDDRQVMMYLERELSRRGAIPLLLSPADIVWSNGEAIAIAGRERRPLDGIVRFFPAEWLPELPTSSEWKHFFCDSATPQSNPASALATQSKRFPLVWNELGITMDAWQQWLPKTLDPRQVKWRGDQQWVLKPALGRVGDGIGIRNVTPDKEQRKIERAARRWPSHWIAQRRFVALPLDTPDGMQFAAIGVFTIDGQAAGIYGRISDRPLIDHRARDVAILIQADLQSCSIPLRPDHTHESRSAV